MIIKICNNCKREYEAKNTKRKYCSRECTFSDKTFRENLSNQRKNNPPSTAFKKGHVVLIETREKIGVGLKKAYDTGQKVAYFKNHKLDEKHRLKLIEGSKNRTFGEKQRLELSERMKINNPMFNQETKNRMTKSIGEKFKNDKEYVERVRINSLKGLLKRPTSFEQKISDLCIKNNLPFVYTGDGRFWIARKNPDFVNKQDKVVIEVFYSWFKIRDYGSVENYIEFCRKKYNSAGWKVIFIDEIDIRADNWEELCLNKINDIQISTH